MLTEIRNASFVQFKLLYKTHARFSYSTLSGCSVDRQRGLWMNTAASKAAAETSVLN